MSQIGQIGTDNIHNISTSFVSDDTCIGSTQIKLPSGTYNVYVEHENIEISRQANFLTKLFKPDQSVELRQVISAQIGPKYQAYKQRLQQEFIQQASLRTTLKEHASMSIHAYIDSHTEHPRFAIYGFQGMRQHSLVRAAADIKKNAVANSTAAALQVTCVDNHNSAIGLHENTVTAAKLPGCIRDLKEGRDNTLQPMEENNPNMYINKDAWRAFLAEHIDKIDIFRSVLNICRAVEEQPGVKLSGWKREAQEHGPAAAMEAFVRKNLSFEAGKVSDTDVKTLAAALMSYSQILENLPEHVMAEKDFNSFCDGIFGKNETLKDLFNSVISTAFFRQTSKLGLDFFKQQGIPVLFAWTDHKGYTVNEEQNNKWWSRGETSDRDGAPITYSEMRYVQRHETKQEPLSVTRIEGTDRAPASPSSSVHTSTI